MKRSSLLLILFFLMLLLQWYVPGSMIWQRERIMETGTDFRFKTAPIDPNDPFRGKYITLSFDHESITVENHEPWQDIHEGYVTLALDTAGFAVPQNIYLKPPTHTDQFIKVKVYPGSYSKDKTLYFNYPFDRFYMDEHKAKPAETLYFESQTDSLVSSWALVSVKDGEAVLKDVLIDGVSVRALVE